LKDRQRQIAELELGAPGVRSPPLPGGTERGL
jgi:hypothetical protein